MAASRWKGETGPIERTSSTQLWSILTLIIAVGGMSFYLGGPPGLAATPTMGTTSAGGSHLTTSFWIPLQVHPFAASPNPVGVGNTTTITATAVGGFGPYNYSYTIPAGLGCPASPITSSFACVPTATGSYSVVVTVNDSGGNVTKNQTSVTVIPFTITSFTVNPSSDAIGTPVSFAANYQGNSGTVTWTWGGLPAGCAAPSGKTLTCTPSAAGTYTVSLTGVDSSLASNTASVTLTVSKVGVSKFTFTPSTVYTGQSTALAVTTTGAAVATLTFSYAGLPPGCLSTNSSGYSCTPVTAGATPGTSKAYTVTVTATDIGGDTSSLSAVLTVKPLTITAFTISPNPSFTGVLTTFTTTALGYLGGVPTYSYSGLPSGCTSSNVPSFSCTPTGIGTFSVVVKVSDSTGNQTTSTVSLAVNPGAEPTLYEPFNTTLSDLSRSGGLDAAHRLCFYTNSPPFYSSTCYTQSQDPSIVSLPGGTYGTTGIAYAVTTNYTNSTCPGASGNANSRVVFGLSTDNGTTLTSVRSIGNASSCAYLDSIEPAFAANAAGDVFGVMIEENSSQPVLPEQYGARAADALGFVSSFSGGTTFSLVRTLDASGNLARPAIAIYGETIYVVYEDIQNSSSQIPGGYYPISLKFIVSFNDGATWSVPKLLPGENATNGYNAMSPSITANSASVAVAYATDRSCIAWVGTPYKTACVRYGSQVVVVSSVSNGSTWAGPVVASQGNVLSVYPSTTFTTFVGETTCQVGACLPYFFQGEPSTAIAFNAAGTKLFVAWAGTTNNTLQPNSNHWWRWSAVGWSGSASGPGWGSWTGGILASPDTGLAGGGNLTNYYAPVIGVSGSKLFVGYSSDNETNTTSGIGHAYPGAFDNAFSQWATNGTIASSSSSAAVAWWPSPAPISYVPVPTGISTNFTLYSFTGFHSALGFTTAGTPLFVYSLPRLPVTSVVAKAGYYAQNTTYPTNLTIGAPAVAGSPYVVPLTFTAAGLGNGASWTFIIDNQRVTTTFPAVEVLNAPKGYPVFPVAVPIGGGYGELLYNSGSYPVAPIYRGPATLSINYTGYVEFNQSFEPNPFKVPLGPGTAVSQYTYEYEGEGFYYEYLCLNVTGATLGCTSAPHNASNTHTQCSLSSSDLGCFLFEIEIVQLVEYYSSYPQGYVENISLFLEEGYCGTGAAWSWCQSTSYGKGSGGLMEWEYYYENYGPITGQTCYVYNYNGFAPFVPVNGSISAGCNATHVSNPLTHNYLSPIWVPLGFKIAYDSEAYVYNGGPGGFPNVPTAGTYANGTGAGAYTGPLQNCALWGNKTCPQVYYSYYYGATYYPTGSWPTGTAYCATTTTYYCSTPLIPETLNGPTNETTWNIPSGGGSSATTYPLEIIPRNLTSGTAYHFTLNGKTYNQVAPSGVVTAWLPAGTYPVSGATANGPPGWLRLAVPTQINVPAQAVVYLYFNDSIEISAPPRAVTFTALNLTNGVPWAFEFNGTIYSTNQTSFSPGSFRPGNYTLSVAMSNSSDGQTRYTPPSGARQVHLVTTSTYAISFVPDYNVSIAASTGGSVSLGAGALGRHASGFYPAGTHVTLNAQPQGTNYQFAGFTGTGTGAYTGMGALAGSTWSAQITVGSPIVETATFVQAALAHDNLSFVENGLPAGTWWTVYLDDGAGPVGHSTALSSLTIGNVYPYGTAGGLGIYRLTVGYAYENGTLGTRYAPSNFPKTVSTNGTASAVPINWSVQYELAFSATPGGNVIGTIGSLVIPSGTQWISPTQTVTLTASPLLGYHFVGWDGTGAGSVSVNGTATIELSPSGAVSEVAEFEANVHAAPATFTAEFQSQTPLPAGTPWSVSVGGQEFSSTTGALNVTGLNGTYALVVFDAYGAGGLVRYVPVSTTPGAVTVTKNATIRLQFTTEYWVDIEASSGGVVQVTKGSATGAAEPAVGWYAAGSQLILAASPSGNYLFESWTGNGTGAYSGTEVSTLVTVNAPINELALFELPPPPIQTKGGFYAQTSTWGIFAVVGLVVGIALGMVLTMMSRRRRQAPPPPEAEEPAPVSENEVVEEPAVPWTEPEEPEGSGSEQ